MQVAAAVDTLARWDITAAVARGAVVGVGGFATLLVAVPASVASSWLLCVRLAFAIAHLGGHDIFEPATCSRVFACVTGDASATSTPEEQSAAAAKAQAERLQRLTEQGQLTAAWAAATEAQLEPTGGDGSAAVAQPKPDAAGAVGAMATAPVVGGTVAVAGAVGEAVLIQVAERAAEGAALNAAQSMAGAVFQRQFVVQMEVAVGRGALRSSTSFHCCPRPPASFVGEVLAPRTGMNATESRYDS
jgi:hypothetical protein